MLLRAIRVSISCLVLMSSILTVAPMAFCKTRVEKESCCKKPELPKHCEQSDKSCPVCSQDLCKVAPTKAKLETESNYSPEVLVTTLAVPLGKYSLYCTATEHPTRQTGPVYLWVCVLRI